MSKRKIIKIDETKCNGCGQCIPNCPEGAIQIIDNKARLISDLFCDGLGACIGYCPQGAITIEERQAQEYDEKKVMANIAKQGENVIKAHLEHLLGHNQRAYLKEALDFLKEKKINISLAATPPATHKTNVHSNACPGSRMIDFRRGQEPSLKTKKDFSKTESELKTWPIQMMLVPSVAPYLQDADLLIAADCVPFAYSDFHTDLLKDKVLLVGCPKLDNTEVYEEKLSQIIENNNIKSITYAHMEVPCCFGLVGPVESAISKSKRKIPFKEVIIGIRGERLK